MIDCYVLLMFTLMTGELVRVLRLFPQPLIAAALADRPQVRHVKIEDGSGRRLGRTFGVKLWPTLVFMRGGKELARLVRPHDPGVIEDALAKIGA
jgi:thioredoxin 1